MRLVALLLIVSMMLSSCAYVTPALCVGASVPIFYASGKAIYHENKEETRDSVKQAIADSLKQEYPAMLQDSLSKKAADIAQKNRERELSRLLGEGVLYCLFLQELPLSWFYLRRRLERALG